jgi:hypothetical protein
MTDASTRQTDLRAFAPHGANCAEHDLRICGKVDRKVWLLFRRAVLAAQPGVNGRFGPARRAELTKEKSPEFLARGFLVARGRYPAWATAISVPIEVRVA